MVAEQLAEVQVVADGTGIVKSSGDPVDLLGRDLGDLAIGVSVVLLALYREDLVLDYLAVCVIVVSLAAGRLKGALSGSSGRRGSSCRLSRRYRAGLGLHGVSGCSLSSSCSSSCRSRFSSICRGSCSIGSICANLAVNCRIRGLSCIRCGLLCLGISALNGLRLLCLCCLGIGSLLVTSLAVGYVSLGWAGIGQASCRG